MLAGRQRVGCGVGHRAPPGPGWDRKAGPAAASATIRSPPSSHAARHV